MKKWILAAALFVLGSTLVTAQHHCLIKVAPQANSHKMEVKADCGSMPDQLLFAEGLQNTLRDQLSVVGVLDFMTDRNWEVLDMEKSVKVPGDKDTPPVYYTEFLFRKRE